MFAPGKILTLVFLSVNIFFTALFLFSGISVYINPESFWLAAIAGMAFPYLLFVNFLFVLLWLFFFKKYFMVSLAAIVLNLGNILAIYQPPGLFGQNRGIKNNNRNIKIMSYNIKAFRVYDKGANDTYHEIIDLLKNENADIICLQEFYEKKSGHFSVSKLKNILKKGGYHIAFCKYVDNPNLYDGIAIISKFPVVNYKKISFQRSRNASMYADVRIHNQTVRVYNLHLQSVGFIKENYDYLDAPQLPFEAASRREAGKISLKLRNAFILRARQVNYFSSHIKNCKLPVIVCGDFNDTPVSYSYYQIKGALFDSFREAGTGIGRTYNGLSAPLRIDYIMHSGHFKTLSFHVLHTHLSDHFPLTANLSFEKK